MTLGDDAFDLIPVPDGRMALRIAGQVAVAGAIVGGLEALGIALSSRFEGSLLDRAAMGAAVVAADATVGASVGLAGGLVAQLLLGRLARWRRYRIGFTLGAVALACGFLGPVAWDLWAVQERRAPAIGMIALGALLSATAWFNAGYWYRREMIGAAPRLGWTVVGAAVSAALALLAAVLGGPSAPRRAAAPPDAANLILVTVDTLRRDHVGAYGALVSTPTIDGLAREGLLMMDAVTPVPETAPSHASMFTGYGPANHDVIHNGAPLRGGYHTVSEQLTTLGWHAGAFVSSFAVDASTGLSQGFDVYDDEFLPAARGATRARVFELGIPLLMRFGDPTAWAGLLERDGRATIARALAWVDRTPAAAPVFLWVHLFEPHSPYEPRGDDQTEVDHRRILEQEPGYAYTPEEEAELRRLYAAEVEWTDARIGELLAGLRASGRLENATVVVVADHGESLGEHGVMFNHHGLYDPVVRVPFVVWSSNPGWAPGTKVERQVTVMDVANTLLAGADVPLLTNTPSVAVQQLGEGMDIPASPVMLVGRTAASLTHGQLRGVRAPNGIKYIQAEDREELYDLRADPGELHDIGAAQPRAVEAGRRNVRELLGDLPEVIPVGDPRLEALGYTEPDPRPPR